MEKFKPVVATRNSDHAHKDYLLAEPAVAYRMLYSNWTRDCLDVMEVTGKLVLVDWTTNNIDPKAQALKFKEIALRLGATPEAIRLLGTLVPLTIKETKTMAEKLKAKGDATALKAAAAKAPVAGKNAAAAKPKARGNPEALAKAREAQQVNKKYKVLVKAKDESVTKLRGWTSHMVGVILANKDTDTAKAAQAAVKGEFADKRLDFTWAAKKGYISTPAA